jgi:hypothetical protein
MTEPANERLAEVIDPRLVGPFGHPTNEPENERLAEATDPPLVGLFGHPTTDGSSRTAALEGGAYLEAAARSRRRRRRHRRPMSRR